VRKVVGVLAGVAKVTGLTYQIAITGTLLFQLFKILRKR
jgi:hypothetical protein